MIPALQIGPNVWGMKAPLIAQIAAGEGAARRDESDIVGAIMLFVVVGLALLLGFLLAVFVMAGSKRRFKIGADLRARKPTASQDVWAMHKVPPYEDDDGDMPQDGGAE